MHPYGRARDLEVLLFSSGSAAFQGVVVPGRYIPLLRPWLTPMPEARSKNVRPDVARSLGAASPLGWPLTVNFGVLVIRRDLWNLPSVPPPSTLAGLREALLALRSLEPMARQAVVTDLPLDELFWDLAWSFEGKADLGLYTFPKVRVLEFIREFQLDRALLEEREVADELTTGRSAAVFTSLQRGLELRSRNSSLAILPLPAKGGRALALYSGWCLLKLSGGRDVERAMGSLLTHPLQKRLAEAGWMSPLISQWVPAAARDAWEKTELYAAPDLGAAGDEIVMGALLDATQGPMTPEESLRRGAARLHDQAGLP